MQRSTDRELAETFRHLRGRYAATVRQHGRSTPEAVAIRSQLAEVQLARFIKRAIAAAPPFSDEQRANLAALLTGDGEPTLLERLERLEARLAASEIDDIAS